MKQSKGVCLSVDLEDIVISAQDRLIDEGYVGSQFKRSADQLVQSQIDGGDILHPDGLFMPITYLYRHCIELKLKALLRTIGECDLSEYDESLLTRHDLIKLWQAIKPALIEQWPKADRKPLSNVEALICDFHKIDKCGQKLRYPSTKEGQDVRGRYPKIVRLELLAQAVDELCSLLDGCHTHFDEILDYIMERRESGSW
jgi:hypothetical protein